MKNRRSNLPMVAGSLVNKATFSISFTLLLLAATSLTSQAQLIWMCGTNDNGWPALDGGGPNASFVQETGSINPLPGVPDSPEVNQQADNDYYFAGIYTNTIPSVVASYGDYTPVGEVPVNEEAAERAFAAADNDLRYHFNLPATFKTNDLLTVSYDPLNLDDPSAVNTDRRYGIEVYFNGVLVQPQIVIRPAELNRTFNTPTFSLASVNAKTGPGWDNIVSLKGINYNADGGGNWMGIDYVQLDSVPPATISITKQPQSVTNAAATTATFTVGATTSASFPLTYQWKKGGVDIAGATGASYTTPVLTLADNGSQFVVTVGVLGANPTNSQTATLTVTPDITPPALLGAKGSPGLTEVVLTFSERVGEATATNRANYQITTASGSLGVTAAALSSDATKVTLTTAPQTAGTKYTVTVNNVADLASPPNVIAANSKAGFFAAGKIVEQNGFIVFEAENFDRNLDGRWIRDTTRGTPSGGVSMVVPNGGGGTEIDTQLEYDIEFKQAATYVVWFRASGNDGADDSGWVHLDGDKPAERVDPARSAAMDGFSGALDFVWLNHSFDGPQPMSVAIAAPGPHVFGLALREDGAFFDKFILTTDTSFTPSGFGPPETRAGQPGSPTVSITSPTNTQTFAAGANVTITVNAAPSTNILAIARVEYSANGTKIGESTASPFSFTWNNVPQGNYTLRATAIDDVGGSTVSAVVAIKVGTPPPLIYFVTADAGPLTFAGDIAVQQRLLNRGFDVRLAQGSAVPNDGSSALGSDLIIQSSSLGSGTVENADPGGGPAIGKFKFLAIPAIVWESSSEDAFGFQDANGTATAADQTQINIVNATHALAAGFPTGLVTVVTAVQALSQGTPTGAHIVATPATDPSQAVIYYYEKGETGFNNFTMPARRVFYYFGDTTASVLTADGFKLFDAAVDWALNRTVTTLPVITGATLSGGNITVQWTGGGTLEWAPSLAAPISWTSTANSTGSFSEPATGTKYYRVKK